MDTKQYNWSLIEKYPFLLPRNVWTDAVVDNFDYSFCLLKDEIPQGWWKCFGEILCEDLKEILVKYDLLDTFRFSQCKEKFGQLRLYDNGHPAEWADHLWAWEYISEHTCIQCGEFPVPMRYDSWISPWCDECFQKHLDKQHSTRTIDSFVESNRFGNRLQEYLCIKTFSKDGYSITWIDLKPFYEKLGHKSENLITKEELEKFLEE